MEVIDFLKEAQRMCRSYHDCKGCPLRQFPCGFIRCIERCSDADIQCQIKVVEQWSKEHQIITNMQKFKEVFGELPLSKLVGCKEDFPRSDPPRYYIFTKEWWDKPYKEPEHE